MQSLKENRSVLDVAEDTLIKLLITCVPSWGLRMQSRQLELEIVSVDNVVCAIDALRRITDEIHEFALQGACAPRRLAELAGCSLAWAGFESITKSESRASDVRILTRHVQRRTSRWRGVMLPVDMSSLLVAYYQVRIDRAEFAVMLAILKAKSEEVRKTLVAQFMTYETRYLTPYRHYSILERYYKVFGLEHEGLEIGHFIRGDFIRGEGDVLIPRSTVYLMLHFMELMNGSSYEGLVGHVGMSPAVRENQLFDRKIGGSFAPGEVSVVMDRWSTQRTGPFWRRWKVLDPEISREMLHLR